MYILIKHGSGDMAWIYPTAEAVRSSWDVQKRIDSDSPETLGEFQRRLDAGEHLNIGIVLTVHKCVNCTPDGGCETLRIVRETAKIEGRC